MTALFILNPGSSSIKWTIYSVSSRHFLKTPRVIADGQVSLQANNNAIDRLITSTEKFDLYALIVRVVHGGPAFIDPTEVTDDNIDQLKTYESLAPLHNKFAMEFIETWRQRDKSVRIFAVFDTQFFAELPRVAQAYALPEELIAKYQIRRYGFHGFAHQDMVKQWREKNSHRPHFAIVTAQLGSGCSMAAIRGGKPVDASMGFTPNEGLLMRTRSGDIDPGLLTWLQQQEGLTPEDTDDLLNHDSGWRGLSGGVDNMAELFASDHPQCRLAFNLFRFRFQKTLGAYFAILGGLEGIVLSGGIVENNGAICRSLLTGLSHLGIELNTESIGTSLPQCLSSPTSAVQCWVVVADEAGGMLRSVQQRFAEDFAMRSVAE